MFLSMSNKQSNLYLFGPFWLNFEFWLARMACVS